MQISRTSKFFSGRGFQIVVVAAALPILGLAFLAWTLLPTASITHTAQAPLESTRRCSLDVITAFRAAGLDARVVRDATKEERDGVFPGMRVDARRFRISAKEAEMGIVLCFQNRDDLEHIQGYYLALNRSLPQFRSWLFVQDNILLQVNREVPERRARAYANVLYTLDQ